jgi:hypothetical protein
MQMLGHSAEAVVGRESQVVVKDRGSRASGCL